MLNPQEECLLWLFFKAKTEEKKNMFSYCFNCMSTVCDVWTKIILEENIQQSLQYSIPFGQHTDRALSLSLMECN